jgi:hypothetical protein
LIEKLNLTIKKTSGDGGSSSVNSVPKLKKPSWPDPIKWRNISMYTGGNYEERRHYRMYVNESKSEVYIRVSSY